jgi:hypothetical protein
MVKPAERMAKTAQKPAGFSDPDMGMGDGWSENGKKGQRKFVGFHFYNGGARSCVLAIREGIQVKKKRPRLDDPFS